MKKDSSKNKISKIKSKYKLDLNKQKKESDNEVPKYIYNIDLFTGVKEEFEKDKNESKNNNIYLKFYNKHTKNMVLPRENQINKKYFNNNLELIKQKQEKYKLKKEKEEEIKKQKEREDSNEYRKAQMAKLYKMENVYKKEIMKRKNNKIRFISSSKKIAIVAKDKEKNNLENNEKNKKILENNGKVEDGKEIKITRKEYEKKIDYLTKETRKHVNELEKMPIANKTYKVYEKERKLNQIINDIQKILKKYENKEGMVVVDD